MAVALQIIKFLSSGTFKLLVIPYKFLAGICGHFIALCIYIPLLFVLFGVFVRLFKSEVVDKSPWQGGMALYHTLPESQQQRLLDITEMAAYAYAFSGSGGDLESVLTSKGYRIQGRSCLNEYGLTYVMLAKGEELFVSFRGSVSLADFLDDSQLLFSGKKLEHLGRFIEAGNLVSSLLKQYPDNKIVLVGHSLGGSTVQYVLRNNSDPRLEAYTVNPYGLPGAGVSHDGRLTDIVHEGDIAQTVLLDSRVVGRGILVRGEYRQANGQWIPEFDLTDAAGQHSIDKTLQNMRRQRFGWYAPPTDPPVYHQTEPPADMSFLFKDTL